MLGKRTNQQSLFDVGNVFDVCLRTGSFYAQLANAADRLFKDESFSLLYSAKMGRPSVPPSQLALMVLMMAYSGVSAEEAIECSTYDLRWLCVLRRAAGEPICARSTLELFVAQLNVNDQAMVIFQSSLAEAKRAGLLSGQYLRIAVDTKPMLGRGAVQDTYNLLASGIVRLARAFARQTNTSDDEWLKEHDLVAYTASSLKGTADIDWSSGEDKDQFLGKIVTDAQRLLASIKPTGDCTADTKVEEAAGLLRQILLQDVVETTREDGSVHTTIAEGTVKGRVPSTTDPEQRHGRKSKQHRFTGHKSSVAADIDSGIIVAVEILAGDDPDDSGLMELVEQAEENTGLPVEETLGDCAYGDGANRQDFADADRKLFAKVPLISSANGMFPKTAFAIDVINHTVTCPGGKTTNRFQDNSAGIKFFFGEACSDCPLRPQCTKSKDGRTIAVHPQETLLKEAREYAQTEEGRAHLRQRLVVENCLGRLGKLGIGQARYFGRKKSRFQLLMAATVANLRRTWNWEEKQDENSPHNAILGHSWLTCEPRMTITLRFNQPVRKSWAFAA